MGSKGTFEIKPGDSVEIICPAPIVFNWFISLPARATVTVNTLVWIDPLLHIPKLLGTGQQRQAAPGDELSVHALFHGGESALVFPHPPLWISTKHLKPLEPK